MFGPSTKDIIAAVSELKEKFQVKIAEAIEHVESRINRLSERVDILEHSRSKREEEFNTSLAALIKVMSSQAEIVTENNKRSQQALQSVERIVSIIEKGEVARLEIVKEIGKQTIGQSQRLEKTLTQVDENLAKMTKISEDSALGQGQMRQMLKSIADTLTSAISVDTSEAEPSTEADEAPVRRTSKKSKKRVS